MVQIAAYPCVVFLSFLLCLAGWSQSAIARENQEPVSAGNRILQHAVFKKASSPEEKAAVEALTAQWETLPHKGVTDRWNDKDFRNKVQVTCAAVDLNRDKQNEVLVRLALQEKDTYLCVHQNCLTFLMELKDGEWVPDLYSYIMAGPAIDVLDRYNNGYAVMQTPAFIAGKLFELTYSDPIYTANVIDIPQKIEKKSPDRVSSPGTGNVLYQLNLEEEVTNETRAAVAAFRSQWPALASDTLADVENWNDPAFKARLILTSAAADLNRDGQKEVLIRLDSKGEKKEFCATFLGVTCCETHIMQLKNGQWQRITPVPFFSLNKILVKDRYHHGFAELVFAGTTLAYDGLYYAPIASTTDNEAVALDEQKEKKIQNILDRDDDLKNHGIRFRVTGVANGIVFLDMYLGNQNIRREIYNDQDFDFMTDTAPTFNEQDLKDLGIIRKVSARISAMDDIQLVQIRPGIPEGKMLLARDRAVHRVSLASRGYLDDLGFSIRADSMYLDDAGLLHARLIIFEADKPVLNAATDPFSPLVYKNIVMYPDSLFPEDSVDIQLENVQTGEKIAVTLRREKMTTVQVGGDSIDIGILNIDKKDKKIRRAKIWLQTPEKVLKFWLKMGSEYEPADTSYTLFIRQTYNPTVGLYFEQDRNRRVD